MPYNFFWNQAFSKFCFIPTLYARWFGGVFKSLPVWSSHPFSRAFQNFLNSKYIFDLSYRKYLWDMKVFYLVETFSWQTFEIVKSKHNIFWNIKSYAIAINLKGHEKSKINKDWALKRVGWTFEKLKDWINLRWQLYYAK